MRTWNGTTPSYSTRQYEFKSTTPVSSQRGKFTSGQTEFTTDDLARSSLSDDDSKKRRKKRKRKRNQDDDNMAVAKKAKKDTSFWGSLSRFFSSTWQSICSMLKQIFQNVA